MRIALLTGEYPPQPGGIGDYTQHLAAALAGRGHGVLVFTIADSKFQIVDLSRPSIKPLATCDLPSAWGWRSHRAVIDALGVTRPDLLHIQYQTGAYAMRPAINLLPWRLRRQATRPHIAVTAHDLLPPYLFPKAGPARSWVTWRLLADADALVVTNPDDAAQARALLGAQARPPAIIPIGSNIAVAPPQGYSRTAWRARLGLRADQTVVAFFGLISRTKGLMTLLDALALLPAELRLLVVGGAASAPEDRQYAAMVRQQIDALGLGPRVTITGHSPPAEVSAHLLAADMAALPFSDGASFRRGSLLAALAHGLPTITTTPGQLGWAGAPLLPALADGTNVQLVPPGDPAALARAIGRLARDSGLRARLAAGGQALARQFGWEAIAAQHEALYATLGAR